MGICPLTSYSLGSIYRRLILQESNLPVSLGYSEARFIKLEIVYDINHRDDVRQQFYQSVPSQAESPRVTKLNNLKRKNKDINVN